MERARNRSMSRLVQGILCVGFLFACAVSAQEGGEEQFLATSLRERTALHYDPLLDSSLDALVALYRGADRVDELIGLYRSHVEQYPEDAGAKTVLIRILRKVDRSGAEELLAASAPLHPDFAPLQYVLFRFLEEKGDPRATEALSRAIDLEPNSAKRKDWLDQLLQLSEGEATRALATAQFTKLLAVPNQSVVSLVSLANTMQRYQFWELSVAALNLATAAKPEPDSKVEIDLLLGKAKIQLGENSEAGQILDALLKRLTPNHWRRREILNLRMSAYKTDEERNAMLAAFESVFRKNPRIESAALDYTDLLLASEKKEEALAALLVAAQVLPKSVTIETRLLELFESSPNQAALTTYLEDRLEREPGRIDLRFLLVKANYALGKDAIADQDFKTVVAGTSPEEASVRILELQRYLRSINRIDAAAPYLEAYLRNHPTRLDVASELAEVYLATKEDGKIDALVRQINATDADLANLLDLAEFLTSNGFYRSAKTIIEARLVAEPNQFDLGLLLISVLGKLGDALAVNRHVTSLREMADTPPRYKRWLEASVSAHRDLESLPGFFETEQNRFSFSDGEWSSDKIEKFLILCDIGKQQLFTAKVADGIRTQLAQPTLDVELKLRLRTFLVGVLERDPSAAAEVEEQLKQLAVEDPAHKLEYELRRALVYHRSQRVDLAQAIVAGIDFTQVTDAPLLLEAVDALLSYGFLEEAEVALATINRLEPSDLLSWERRLSVLVSLRSETTFRSVIRSLQNGAAGVKFRELSDRSLEEHLGSSYWRSISAMMASGEKELQEILALLASAEREELMRDSRLWAEWTRSLVLTRLGRNAESTEAIARFREIAKLEKKDSVAFPDGLILSVDAAADFLSSRPQVVAAIAPPTVDFLLNQPVMKWAFELPREVSLRSMGRAEGIILVEDSRETIHAIDAETGKLRWSKEFGRIGGRSLRGRPKSFQEMTVPAHLRSPEGGDLLRNKLLPPLLVAGTYFFIVRDGAVSAFHAKDASLAWSAPLPTGGNELRRDVSLAVEGACLVAYPPDDQSLFGFEVSSGKLLWETDLGEPSESATRLSSLNSGLTVKEGHAFLYGKSPVIVELASGEVVWRFDGNESSKFPLVLRPVREGNEPVPPILPDAPATELYDFQANFDQGKLDVSDFLNHSSTLVGPAVFWSKSRLVDQVPSFAAISEGYLLLMQSGKVRRVSTRLPVASRELPASGTFLGQTGNHAWFLDGGYLLHLDFYQDRASKISLHDLGDPASIRAVLSGNQIVVRGRIGLKLINARTALILGSTTLPARLVEFLANSRLAAQSGEAVAQVWQGTIFSASRGEAGYCIAAPDLISERQYITAFDRQLVVCLESAADLSPALPPSPPTQP